MIALLLVILFIWAFIAGSQRCDWLELGFDVHEFKSPYFSLGLHFRKHIRENGLVLSELTIGLIFLNITLEFYKLPEDEEE